jgi:hypothetical protein
MTVLFGAQKTKQKWTIHQQQTPITLTAKVYENSLPIQDDNHVRGTSSSKISPQSKIRSAQVICLPANQIRSVYDHNMAPN